jgi:hypothetical protein
MMRIKNAIESVSKSIFFIVRATIVKLWNICERKGRENKGEKLCWFCPNNLEVSFSLVGALNNGRNLCMVGKKTT